MGCLFHFYLFTMGHFMLDLQICIVLKAGTFEKSNNIATITQVTVVPPGGK